MTEKAPTGAVPTSPVFPAVDCAARKRKRTAVLVAPLIPPPHPVGEPRTLTPEELAYCRNGATFYEEASKYFDRMNEDIRRHDEQFVYSSFCKEMDRDRDMHEKIFSYQVNISICMV